MHIGLSKQLGLVAGVAVVGTLVLAGCSHPSKVTNWQANGTPVHESANEPWWNYQLVYHPNTGVYFEPYSQTWHWQEGGEWRSSTRRPAPVAWRADEAVIVKLNWDTPEFGDTTVSSVHPQLRVWDRMYPITVSPIVQEDTALTNAESNVEAPRDVDEVIDATPPRHESSALTGVTETDNPE